MVDYKTYFEQTQLFSETYLEFQIIKANLYLKIAQINNTIVVTVRKATYFWKIKGKTVLNLAQEA